MKPPRGAVFHVGADQCLVGTYGDGVGGVRDTGDGMNPRRGAYSG